MEESLQRLDLILDKKLSKKRENIQHKINEPIETKPIEHNLEAKILGNDRYKNSEISPKIEENYNYNYENEIENENEFIFEDEQQNKTEINETNVEDNKKPNKEIYEKKINGYYAIKNQKKNQESYLNETKISEKITNTNSNFEISSNNHDGKIKIINKENLKKLLE